MERNSKHKGVGAQRIMLSDWKWLGIDVWKDLWVPCLAEKPHFIERSCTLPLMLKWLISWIWITKPGNQKRW